MASKPVFPISDHNPRRGDARMTNSPYFRRQAYNPEELSYPTLDESLKHSPQLLWQAMTPETRSETIKRLQLIQLFRQVNPNLQVCRRPTVQMSTSTAEKGVQVPDMRYELSNSRRSSARKEQNLPLVAPGVRIHPRDQTSLLNNVSIPDILTLTESELEAINQSSLDQTKNESSTYRPVVRDSFKVGVKATTSKSKKNPTKEKKPLDDPGTKVQVKAANTEQQEETVNAVGAEEGKPPAENGDKRVVKSTGSSAEEDSIVVVLDQLPSQQGLERKYGQFFCRRCLRGWSSRSVWCLRNSCKVYIKQTCNSCNKLVNPYLVCRLPKFNSSNKEAKQ